MTPPSSWLLNRPRRLWLTAIGLMALLALAWLSYQGIRYFAEPDMLGSRTITPGAIDLRNRFLEARTWFAGGGPVYRIYRDAIYPPASYALFGAVFHALNWGATKVLWFLLSLVSVSMLSWQLVRHSLARQRHEQVFLGLMPFAFYATGAALGNGQLVLFVLPLALNAVLLLDRAPLTPGRLWLGSLLMLLALVQPAIAAPFFWLVLLRAPGFRPGALVVSAYLALTAFALTFQIEAFRKLRGDADGASVFGTWSRRAQGGSAIGSMKGGYGTVHNLLGSLRIKGWNMPVSIAILLLLGGWIYRNRRADLWLLLGVTAIVARIWTYHRWYDDLLLLLPLISLFRITRLPSHGPRIKTLAAVLFVWIWLFLLAPGVLYLLPSPGWLIGLQVAGWIAALGLLVVVVERDRAVQPQLPAADGPGC